MPSPAPQSHNPELSPEAQKMYVDTFLKYLEEITPKGEPSEKQQILENSTKDHVTKQTLMGKVLKKVRDTLK